MKEFAIILTISFLGEFLNYALPLPVPASIYGLLIMLICLMSGIIKVDMVKDASGFLIEIMPLMFIPAGVGLLESWGVLKPVCIPVITITLVSTVVVMGITGLITQHILLSKKKEEL